MQHLGTILEIFEALKYIYIQTSAYNKRGFETNKGES